MIYLIGYEPFHDNGWLDTRVFASLEAARGVLLKMTHDYYAYESVTIFEVDITVKPVAMFNIDRDNVITEGENHYGDSNWMQVVKSMTVNGGATRYEST